MKIFIRVDASYFIGTGHVVRCVTLAKELRRLGASCTFLSRDHDGNLFDYILANGFELKILKNNTNNLNTESNKPTLSHSNWLSVSQSRDAAESIELINDQNPDWLVVDHYGIDFRWHEELRPHCKKIFVIDDLADRKHDCDLLLDQNLVNNYLTRYENKVAREVPKLLGPKYALLQKEYLDLKARVFLRKNKVENILVYFGGSDLHNLTESIVDILQETLKNTVTVDVVSNHPSGSLIDKIGRNKNFNLHSTLDSLAPLMLRADLAIGGSGTSSWERICLGLPSIVITVAHNQLQIAQELHRRGYIHYLGHYNDFSKMEMQQILDKCLHDDSIELWSKKCLNLIDGLGCYRVADLMLVNEKSTIRIRSAETKDSEFVLQNLEQVTNKDNNSSKHDKNETSHWFNELLKSPDTGHIAIIETVNHFECGLILFEKINTNYELTKLIVSPLPNKINHFVALHSAVKYFFEYKISTTLSFSKTYIDSQDLDDNLGIKQDKEIDSKLLSFCSDHDSWINSYLPNLFSKLLLLGHKIAWHHDSGDLGFGDVCFYLSFSKKVPDETRAKFKNNIVIHESALPEGRGMSPVHWQILKGQNEIIVSLLEINDSIDGGDIYSTDKFILKGTELLEEIRQLQYEVTERLSIWFIKNIKIVQTLKKSQKGEPSYFRSRKQSDNELDVKLSLLEQFNLLRVSDNERYPAFFYLNDEKFILKIYKEDVK